MLSRMIAAALAVGVGAPALAQERPTNDYSEEQQALEQDEVRRVGRSRQSSEDVELQAAQAQAAQQVRGQSHGQEQSPEHPNPRALEVRQSEEAHARNAEREAEGAQRQAGQGRWLQE
ncbi:MAG: hypothetical protein ACR2HE_13915, partial [Casimicrobiaceae bacterium]